MFGRIKIMSTFATANEKQQLEKQKRKRLIIRMARSSIG